MYDVIIIGGGIAGLYTAYKLCEKYNILLIERNKVLGGRASNTLFKDVSVVTGAGIGRKKKDNLLINLMNEFEFPIKEFRVNHDYSYSGLTLSKDDFYKMFKQLRSEYIKKPICSTFKNFAIPILGKKMYNEFIIFNGFTDFENEDVFDTLFNYGMEDNLFEWTGFSVPWKKLVEKMKCKIGLNNILLDKNVIQIQRLVDTTFSLKLNDNTKVMTKNVVIATTIESVLSLVKVQRKFYKQIKSQPFLRLYGKFTKDSALLIEKYIKTTTILQGPLQKIIPMDKEKGVYMISYSDNKNALFLKPYIENTKSNKIFLCNLLEDELGLSKNSLHLESIKGIYWESGTHYYLPNPSEISRQEFIHKAQRPMPGMFIVGEMISMNQGWVEGALESVESVLCEI